MVYLEINDRSPIPIYEQIMDGIQRFVREGTLAPGALLPSVRQLASDLEINPNTVAKAYSLLEKDGIIETARRRGTRISATATSRSRQSLTDRADAAADRLIHETAHLELSADDLVSALVRRLKTPASKRKPS